MTDADIARDNISRDAYAAVAARRTQFDQLVWQVPVLSLTAQAFLFSIALSPAGTRTTRIIASLLSLVMTFLSLHLMVKHRQAEVADGQWLEAYEKEFPAPVGAPRWPMHGRSWADYRNSIDPNISPWRLVETHWVPDLELGPLGVWDGSDHRSATGHLRARLARILIARRPVPPLPHRARTFHQRAERVFAKGSGISVDVPDSRSLIDVVLAKIIESDLAVSRSPDEDPQP
jgi:hypothetical protein